MLSAYETPELSGMGDDIGPASKESALCNKGIGLLVCELKDSTHGPLEMLGQAFASNDTAEIDRTWTVGWCSAVDFEYR